MADFLASYKGIRYHCLDFHSGRQPREGRNVNYSHSSLRDAIKHSFRVRKAHCLILQLMSAFPFETQGLVLIASIAIHNYIREMQLLIKSFNLIRKMRITSTLMKIVILL